MHTNRGHTMRSVDVTACGVEAPIAGTKAALDVDKRRTNPLMARISPWSPKSWSVREAVICVTTGSDMSVIDDVRRHLGAGGMQQLAEEIGADPARTERAVQAAVPMLLGGVANRAGQPGGEADVHQAMNAHQSLLGGAGGGLLGALGGILGSAGVADGGGLLGKVLGGHQATVQDGVAQSSGLDGAQVKRLLVTLAPIVLAMLAKRHAATPSTSVGTTVQREAQEAHAEAQRSAPHVGGVLGKILDSAVTPRP